MRLRVFTGGIIVLVLSLFYIGSTTHYFHDRAERHVMLKSNMYDVMTDLDFSLSKNNCRDLKQSSVLIKRKLATNKYL
ncbi:MAG: hypothetical protein DRH57_09140, partial [Candidatus Cloacimonadota bacterium]